MTNSNQRYLVFVEPYRLYIYSTQMEQPYPVDIPITAVRDVEILNRDQVYSLVDAFVTANGMTGGSIVMVLSQSLLFEKQIVQDLSDEVRRTAAIKEYIDNVPFEQTAYVSYPIQTGIGIIATNEEFFGTLKRAFERKNITVNLVVPAMAFGDVKVSPQTGPDAQTASFFLDNIDQVKQFAFHVSLPVVTGAQKETKKKIALSKGPSKKLPIYLSVFGLLILVLVIVIVVNNQPPANKPTTTTVAAEAPAAALAPPSVEEEGTGSAELDRARLKIQIKTPVLFRTRIDEIRGRMTAAGYTTVDVVEAPAAESTVLYLNKTNLTVAQRSALMGDMRTYFNEFSVQEVEQAEYAAQVVVGREL